MRVVDHRWTSLAGLANLEADGWEPCQVRDGAVGSIAYSHGLGESVLVRREVSFASPDEIDSDEREVPDDDL
jgi:hypothetical protein